MAARITKADLDEHARLAAEAAELGRRARTLRAGMAEIEDRAQADLETSGKEEITRGGYRLSWAITRAGIKWRGELLSRIGAEAVAELEATAGNVRAVKIEPPKA